MQTLLWGLLGSEQLASRRRTRTLGLGAIVRSFNDRAVAGLGGVWFGKQLFLATLGVAVAQRVRAQRKRVQNIEVANAIEALACWLAYEENGWERDPRLRGRTKLRYKGGLDFATVRRPSFYVTQPMRRATLQALPALGLVEADGPRFNSFRIGLGQADSDEEASIGMKLISAVCAGCKPHHKTVVDVLTDWVLGVERSIATPEMREALSPLKGMSGPARVLLRGRVAKHQRRENARRWVDDIHNEPHQVITLEEKPAHVNEDHWHDLCGGTRFFAARAVALGLLNKIEECITSTSGKSMHLDQVAPVREEIAALEKRAREFLDSGYPEEPEATRFCKECIDSVASNIIRNLVKRDGRVLRLNGEVIELDTSFSGQKPGTGAAESNTEDEGAEEEVKTSQSLPFPQHMSPRISNLYYLNLDLYGGLPRALK